MFFGSTEDPPYNGLLNRSELERLLKCENEQQNFYIGDSERKKSESWRNFDEIFYKNVKQHFVRCKVCKNLLVHKSSTGTAGMMRHKCNRWLSAVQSQSKTNRSPSASGIIQYPPKKSSVATIVTNSNRLKLPEQDRRRFEERHLAVIGEDIRFLHMIQGEQFKAFAQELIRIGTKYGPQDVAKVLMPESTLMNATLPAVIEQKKQIILNLLEQASEVGSLAFTCDFWTDQFNNRQYLTLSGYTISDAFKMYSFVLGTREIDSCQEICSTVINSILMTYMVTEEASRRLLSKSFIVTSDEFSKEFDGFRVFPCICHCLNDLIEDVIQNFPSEIQETLDNVNDVVKYFDKFALTGQLSKTLNRYVPDRWDTLHEMLDSFLSIYWEVEPILTDRNEFNRLQTINLDLLRTILNLLSIFKECIERLTSSKDDDLMTSLNEVYLWKMEIEEFCQITTHDPPIVRTVKKQLLHSSTEQFPIDDLHKIALILNPDFKDGSSFDSDRKEYESVLEILRKLLRDVQIEEGFCEVYIKSEENGKMVPHILPNYMMQNNEGSQQKLGEMELELYLQEDISEQQSVVRAGVLEYWRQTLEFPLLRKLARKIFCIPAFCSACECRFSPEMRQFCQRRVEIPFEYLNPLILYYRNEKLQLQSHKID